MTATALTSGTTNPLDVLVVGAGPAGLATAITAVRNGSRVLLVERHAGTSIFPRATGVNTRTMEVFRSWGLHRRIRVGDLGARPLMSVSATLREAPPGGLPIGYPTDPREVLAVSPVLPSCCPQDHIEPVLLERLLQLGADVRFGVELQRLVDDGDGITADLLDRATGATTRVGARFVVGADGPRSAVRRELGIPLDRQGSLGEHVNIIVRADLDAVIGDRRFALYVIEDPEHAGVFIRYGGDRWGFVRQWNPDRGESLDDFTPQRCVDLVRAAAGAPDLDVRVLARLPFTMAADVARSFRAGNGFLVGDAAHRMTPVGAVGMNTAIQGAHNLGWKLAWVARGWAGDGLLDSYEAERRPPAEHNARRSLQPGAPQPADALAADLGCRYSSTVIAEATPGRGAEPGCRAPHVWVDVDGHRRSTLDLYDGRITLLTGLRSDGWRAAAARSPLPIQVLGVGQELADGRLADHYGIDEGGAVLVRPDGYIAWRCDAVEVPDTELRAALGVALGLGECPTGSDVIPRHADGPQPLVA